MGDGDLEAGGPPGALPARGVRLWPAAAALLVAVLLLALTSPGRDEARPTVVPTTLPSTAGPVPVTPPPQLVQSPTPRLP
jgi:hypothetical protein